MKNLLILLFLAAALPLYAQPESDIIMYERETKDINESSFYLKNFWLDDGNIKASLETYKLNHGKPISGGYGIGSRIEFGESGTNTFYIKEAFKLGKDEPGFIVFSPQSLEADTNYYYEDTYEFFEGDNRKTGDLSIRIVSIQENNALFDLRNDRYSYLQNTTRFVISEKDTLWLGRAAYIADKIGRNGYGVESVFLKRLYQLYPFDAYAIPGELINAPVKTSPQDTLKKSSASGMLLIRKMQYQKSQKDYNAEVRICLVRIVTPPGPGEEIPAMPYIPVMIGGEKVFLPFVYVKVFESEQEALQYALENKIYDINLTGQW